VEVPLCLYCSAAVTLSICDCCLTVVRRLPRSGSLGRYCVGTDLSMIDDHGMTEGRRTRRWSVGEA
jgi:hypothetical protein